MNANSWSEYVQFCLKRKKNNFNCKKKLVIVQSKVLMLSKLSERDSMRGGVDRRRRERICSKTYQH